MNTFTLIIGSIIFGVVAINATIVSECDDLELPLSVTVPGCDEEPCDVIRGKTLLTNMTFIAPNNVKTLETDVLVHALGTSLHFPLGKPCESLLNGKCPISAGDRITYQLKLPILKIYPLIPIQLMFTMKDENSNGLFCFNIELQVVD